MNSGKSDREREATTSSASGVESDEGLTDRVGELAQSLLDNPLVSQALGTAFGARNRAMGAQRVAMSALDIPSASDLERLERRLRSASERVGALESEVDRLAAEVRRLREAALTSDEEV